MTKRETADRRAAEQGSGKGGESNEAGTAHGPGSSADSRSKQDNQRDIAGQGSAKTAHNRPGHKNAD